MKIEENTPFWWEFDALLLVVLHSDGNDGTAGPPEHFLTVTMRSPTVPNAYVFIVADGYGNFFST